MGSCFSSSGSAGEDYGEERRVRRVWPSDDDGGEWDVDNRAAIFIAKFHHRHQSGVVCSDCADQQQTPAAATAAGQ